MSKIYQELNIDALVTSRRLQWSGYMERITEKKKRKIALKVPDVRRKGEDQKNACRI